jgi:hypothetical protein
MNYPSHISRLATVKAKVTSFQDWHPALQIDFPIFFRTRPAKQEILLKR